MGRGCAGLAWARPARLTAAMWRRWGHRRYDGEGRGGRAPSARPCPRALRVGALWRVPSPPPPTDKPDTEGVPKGGTAVPPQRAPRPGMGAFLTVDLVESAVAAKNAWRGPNITWGGAHHANQGSPLYSAPCRLPGQARHVGKQRDHQRDSGGVCVASWPAPVQLRGLFLFSHSDPPSRATNERRGQTVSRFGSLWKHSSPARRVAHPPGGRACTRGV